MIICMKNVCSILVDANTIVIEIVIAIPANMISLLNDSNEMTFFCKNSSNRSARYTRANDIIFSLYISINLQ